MIRSGVHREPADEPQLRGLPSILGGVVLVKHSVSTVCIRHRPLEIVEGLTSRTDLFDLDLEVAYDEYDVPVLAAQLERLVLLISMRRDRSHERISTEPRISYECALST